MNACEKAYLQMNLLLDDMLEPEQQEQLQAHLETCARCRETYAQLRAMTCLLREEQEPVPETLHTSVMAAVRRERQQPTVQKPKKAHFRPKRLIKMLGTLAACAAVVLMLRAVLPGSKSQEATMNVNGAASMNRPAFSADNAEGFLYDMTGDDADYGYGELPPETPESKPMPETSRETAEIELPDHDASLTKAAVCQYYAEGSREALPAWAEDALEQCVVDNAVFDCVELDTAEAEERLNDLRLCGFMLEPETEETGANGIRILFRWQ